MAYYGNAPADVALVVGSDVITTTEIQDATIATADIANDAITAVKIDDDGTGFQMGSLGLGTAVSGSEKLTVGGTASFADDISLTSGKSITSGNMKMYIDVDAHSTSASYATFEALSDRGIDIRSQSQTRFYTDNANTLALTLDASQNAIFTTNIENTGHWKCNDTAWSGEIGTTSAGKIQYHSDTWYLQANAGWRLRNGSGTNVVILDSSGNADFDGGIAVNGGTLGSHKLVVDNGTSSLNRGNSAGDILDVRGLNASQMKVTTSAFTVTPSATFTGDVQINKSVPSLVIGNGGNTTSASIRLGGDNSSGGRLFFQYSGDSSYIDSYGGHGSTETYRNLSINARNLYFKTGSGTQALYIDNDQKSTFSDNVRISNSKKLVLNGTDEDWYLGVDSSYNIVLNGGGSGSRAFVVKDHNDSNAERFNLNLDTGNATFAGDITSGGFNWNGINLTAESSSDAPIISKSTDGTTGVQFRDSNSNDGRIYYVGSGNYFYMNNSAELHLRDSGGATDITLNPDGNSFFKGGDVTFSGGGYDGEIDTSDTGKTGFQFHQNGVMFHQIDYNSYGAEIILLNNIHSAGAICSFLQYRTRNTVEGSLHANSSGLAISNVSDYRKKERITDLSDSLNTINSLRPRQYYYREGFGKPTRAFAGFIAHELQDTTLSHLTTGTKDQVVTQEDLDNGLHSGMEVGDPVYQTVSYADNELITHLVKAVQELSAKVTALENA